MNNYLKIMAIAALPLMFAGCADNDEVIAGDETVEVSFSAALPQKIQSRAAGSTLNVNKVVCATFDSEGNEIEALREVVDIVDGQDIQYAPRLVKDHTYQVAFWAMKEGAYNVTDMKNISRKAGEGASTDESDFECFANHTAQFTVSGNANESITLSRPVARLRLGTSEADLDAVKALGYTPTSVEVKLTTNNAYNALEGKVTGTASKQTFTLPVSTEGSITAGESTYKSLTSNYVFASDGNVTVTLTIKGKKNTEGATEENICTRTVDNVPLHPNKNTNIVGDLMTGTVIYTITMESEYGDRDENKPV